MRYTFQRQIRVFVVKIQRCCIGCSFNRGPHELRERVGRGETAATSTSRASSLLQARFDEGAVVIYFVEHRANEVSNEIYKISRAQRVGVNTFRLSPLAYSEASYSPQDVL